jgi:3-hydroxybutyryl-CoA dehydratase
MDTSLTNPGSSQVGRTQKFEILLTEALIDAFGGVSGDRNPVHMSTEHAKRLGHSKRVVHGMLLGSLVSRLVGEHLPGGDVLLLSIKIDFHQTVYAGDTIEVSGTIERESPATGTLDIKFSMKTSQKVVVRGTALVQRKTPKSV